MRPCIFIVGTRAQLVKVAPVLQCAVVSGLSHTVWLAGQHCESIDDLIDDFGLKSKIVSPTFRDERSSLRKLAKWAPQALRECHRYVRSVATREKRRPLVIVHGDTLSTLVGALAGKIAGGEVVHLESGLSSKNFVDPFPEEAIRRLTFKFARYALCPNAEASERMRRYRNCEVVDTGENTLLDCVRFAVARNENTMASQSSSHFVASIHRFQNIYRKSQLSDIVEDIVEVSALGDVHFVLHPPTETRLRKAGLWDLVRNAAGLKLVPRMPFTRFLALLANARGVFSDGGSNQEELSYLGIPTVLFRQRSERPDGLDANVVLRKNIEGSLADFVKSGGLDSLRKPRHLNVALQPSETTVKALLRWSACATTGLASQ